MSDPRKVLDFKDIGYLAVTMKAEQTTLAYNPNVAGGHASVGKAVSLCSATGVYQKAAQVKLGADNEPFYGKLIIVYKDGFCVVQIRGFMQLPGTPALGQGVCCAAAGAIKAGATTAVTGVTSVWTITFGGTPTGGTFKLGVDGVPTAAITWSNVNATLLAAIDAALEALLGAGTIAAAATTMVAGIGAATLTFGGSLALKAPPPLSVYSSSLTGTAPTVAIVQTTAGVTAQPIFPARGLVIDDTTDKSWLFI